MSLPSLPIRLPWVDAARGIAILAMVVYHFSWDLGHFGFIAADVATELGWVIFARLIAGSFLFLVGVSLVLAAQNGIDRRRFVIRLGMIVAGAAAVSLVTWFAMRQAFVFFGILHLIAASSVLGLLFLRLPALVLLALAVAVFAVWWTVEGPFFDQPYLLWVGLGTVPPVTNDYTPIFPWFGVVLAGMAAATLFLRRGRLTAAFARPAPPPLTSAGRHSLAIYLIHQPVLYGLTWLAATMIPPDPAVFEARHTEGCTMQCAAEGLDEFLCRNACACLSREAAAAGLSRGLLSGVLDEEDTVRYFDLAYQCRAQAEAAGGGPDM